TAPAPTTPSRPRAGRRRPWRTRSRAGGVPRIRGAGRGMRNRMPAFRASPSVSNALLLDRRGVPAGGGRWQLSQRLRLAAAVREKSPLAGFALRPLFPTDPLVRQHPAAQLLVPTRPLSRLRRRLLRTLFLGRADDRPAVRRPVLPRSGPQRARPAAHPAG